MIDEAGNQLGVMSLFDAMKAARDSGLDVVEISPNAVPPVCKLVDYGKFLYEQNKKAHEQKKHQKSSHIKEVKFRPSTAEHDYQVRKNQIIRFLGDGFKVKAMIFHRGREMAHQDVGRAKMDRLLKDITDHAQVEFGPRMEANILLALLAPKKGAAATRRARAVRGRRRSLVAFRRATLPAPVVILSRGSRFSRPRTAQCDVSSRYGNRRVFRYAIVAHRELAVRGEQIVSESRDLSSCGDFAPHA